MSHGRADVRSRSGEGAFALGEAQLLEGAQSGRGGHSTKLYERTFPRIDTFIDLRVRNHADAEELAQETYTVVFRYAKAFSGRSTPLAWIRGIASNTVLDHLRRVRIRDERLLVGAGQLEAVPCRP